MQYCAMLHYCRCTCCVGYLYDLSPLKTVPNYVLNEDVDHIYNISICQPLLSSPCGPNSGKFQHCTSYFCLLAVAIQLQILLVF